MKKRYGMTGTPYFCSQNTLKWYDQSRRDDLESVGYSIIHLAKNGRLPWKNLDE